MAYVRKTRDVWRIYVDYGYGDGWEHECTELSRKAARENIKAYRENYPQYPVKVVQGRERIENNVTV